MRKLPTLFPAFYMYPLPHFTQTLRQYTAEEFVVAVDSQLRRRSIIGKIETSRTPPRTNASMRLGLGVGFV